MPKKMDRESVVFCLSSGLGWAVVGLGVGLAVVGLGVDRIGRRWIGHRWLSIVGWPRWLAIVGWPSLVGHRSSWVC